MNEKLLALHSFLRNEPMAKYTTFKIGGPAEYFAIVKTKKDLIKLTQICQMQNIPLFVFGGGSNILVSDWGIKGVVVCNKTATIEHKDKNFVEADSGAMLSSLIRFCAEKKLSGLENFSGIPGSVGGALWINTHFLNFLIGDYVESGEIIDERGNVLKLARKDFHFGYEQSLLKERKIYLLSATFKLSAGKREIIEKRTREILKLRCTKHPLKHPSAGSVFRNPSLMPAGKIIEEAGLKGKKIGQAQVSEKHANFIVNLGGAKADDVLELISICQKEVFRKFKVRLEPEINFVGEGNFCKF